MFLCCNKVFIINEADKGMHTQKHLGKIKEVVEL